MITKEELALIKKDRKEKIILADDFDLLISVAEEYLEYMEELKKDQYLNELESENEETEEKEVEAIEQLWVRKLSQY